MLRFILITYLMVLATASQVFAQQPIEDGGRLKREGDVDAVKNAPDLGAEIGTLFGLTHLRVISEDPFGDDDGVTLIGVPGHPISLGDQTLYVSWFPSEQLAIRPEFNLSQFSDKVESFTLLYLGGQGAFFPKSNATSGLYILGRGGLLTVSADGSPGAFLSVGAGLGYQWHLGSAFVLRTEARYQRWLGVGGNGLSLVIGLGTRVGHINPEQHVHPPRVEIGTLFGLSHFRPISESSRITMLGAPEQSTLSLGYQTLYVSWAASKQLAIRPEFSFSQVSYGLERITTLYLGGQGAFFPQNTTMSGPYILGRGGLLIGSPYEGSYDQPDVYDDVDIYEEPPYEPIPDLYVEEPEAASFSVGAGLGYQWHLGSAFVLRTEARYQRWFGEYGGNGLSLLLGIGTRLGGR